jgi:chemotaxis protein MotB
LQSANIEKQGGIPMLRMRHVALLLLAGSMMNGCVALDKYNALKLERDQYLERLSQAESEARAEREKAKVLKDQLDALLAAGGNQQDLLANLTKKNADLQAAMDELNRKYQNALTNPIALPAEVNTELSALAQQFPDVFEFDAARGLLKFKSDVTFASGSADVTPRAREVLRRVSEILNNSSVAGYDLLVAGHTDSVRVTNPATIKLGHKDNWYLSAHRAVSVGAELRNAGTAASRIGVVGYADQRPVASNATAEGKGQNRRVEILVLPAHNAEKAAAAPAAQPAPARRTAPAAAPAAGKDGGELVPAPATPEESK